MGLWLGRRFSAIQTLVRFLRSFETVPPPRPLEIKPTPIRTEADIEQAVAQIESPAAA